MNQWIQMGESENAKIIREEKQRQAKLIENQLILKEQMQGLHLLKK